MIEFKVVNIVAKVSKCGHSIVRTGILTVTPDLNLVILADRSISVTLPPSARASSYIRSELPREWDCLDDSAYLKQLGFDSSHFTRRTLQIVSRLQVETNRARPCRCVLTYLHVLHPVFTLGARLRVNLLMRGSPVEAILCGI